MKLTNNVVGQSLNLYDVSENLVNLLPKSILDHNCPPELYLSFRAFFTENHSFCHKNAYKVACTHQKILSNVIFGSYQMTLGLLDLPKKIS